MQVFSSEQFQRLISPTSGTTGVLESLLDIGAGDGSTTDRMASHFQQVYVTEMSTTMRWTLQKKGYQVLDVANWAAEEPTRTRRFDVISCLNVLDRCEKPWTLLGQIREALKPGGIAVLAFVIPFKPYVEFGEITDKNLYNGAMAVTVSPVDCQFCKVGKTNLLFYCRRR